MINNEPLFDFDNIDDAHTNLRMAAGDVLANNPSPEARVLRYLLTHVGDLHQARTGRNAADVAPVHAADDSDMLGREVQVLADLRTAVEEALGNSIRSANSRGASWQKIGDLLGTSRQAAHERYAI